MSDDEMAGAAPGVSDFGISTTGKAVSRPSHPATAEPGHLPDPRFGAADAVRRITTALVGLPLADEKIEEFGRELADLAARIERAAAPGRRPRAQPDPASHAQNFFPTSPVIGFANPVAPPVLVEVVDGELHGRAYFDYQYEGPPTCVHGGVIALVFDELLGAANIAAGCPGMTGTLTVRYRRPTPLRTPLRLEARCTRREGRKVVTWGGIFRDDELLAEAEGIFIELVPDRFLEIITANASAETATEVEQQVRADAQRLFGERRRGGP